MRERGYIERQNVAFDVRWPKGTFSDDPDAVTHLVKGNFDVIVAPRPLRRFAARLQASRLSWSPWGTRSVPGSLQAWPVREATSRASATSPTISALNWSNYSLNSSLQ